MSRSQETWSEDAPPEPDEGSGGRDVAGRYSLLALVGQGATGSVYRAYDAAIDEVVALKLTRADRAKEPAVIARIRHELRLSRKITHPNVVRTFDVGEHDGHTFLTMEYLDGGSLAERLADEGALPPGEAVRVAREVCAGLGAVHAAGVVHRDLKPDNVMFGRAGGGFARVAVADFGIAAPIGTEGGAGTPAYLAPEQVARGAVTPATDLWAVGELLYEMLTGERPFPGAVEDRLSTPAPVLVAPVDPGLAAIVARCLLLRPEDRWPDAAALSDALSTAASPVAGPIALLRLPSVRAVGLAIVAFDTPDTAGAWLGRSVAAEIGEVLAQSARITVRSPSVVQEVVGDLRQPVNVARRMGVDAALVGSVERTGEKLRLRAELWTADGVRLVASRAEVAESEAMQALWSVASQVAGALSVDLPAGDQGVRARPELLEALLKARHHLRVNWTLGDLDPIEEMLAPVAAELPRDPLVAATRAMALARLGFRAMDAASMADRLGRALAIAEAARRITPDSGPVALALGVVHLYSGRPVDSAVALQDAARLSPGLAHVHHLLGVLWLEVGDLERAGRHLDVTLSLDPTWSEARTERARLCAYLDDWDGVVRHTEAEQVPWRVTASIALRNRYLTWSPKAPQPPTLEPAAAEAVARRSPWMARFVQISQFIRANWDQPELLRPLLQTRSDAPNPRQRSARCQYMVESCSVLGFLDLSYLHLHDAIDAGLFDVWWLDACPALANLRASDGFAGARAPVAARAAAVEAALRA